MTALSDEEEIQMTTLPTNRGEVTWHSSGPDEGPDVGVSVSLGLEEELWFGEISRRLFDDCGGAEWTYAWNAVVEMEGSPPPPPEGVNAKLVEALEFYANPFNRKDAGGDPVRIPDFYSELCFGNTANEALATVSRRTEGK